MDEIDAAGSAMEEGSLKRDALREAIERKKLKELRKLK